MNIEIFVIIGISLLTLLFIVLFIITKIKYHKLLRKFIDKNKEYTHIKTKLSMIEYYHRNYKEGMNPFTVLRDITNTLDSDEDIDEHI